MEIFAITDAVKLTATATQYLGFSKLLRDTTSPTGVLLSISAGFSPVDAIAPPISRPRAVPRCPPQRKRRTRKRSATGDSDDGGDEPGFFSGDLAFGGDDGGGRGGGDDGRRWWNFEPDDDGDDGDSWNFSFAYDFMNESFWLDRGSGKKCFMETARHLRILWADDSQYWTWESMPQSRFSEVANLSRVWTLDIFGTINTHNLSKKTTYVAYLVVRFNENLNGLDSKQTEVTVEIGDQVSKIMVRLIPYWVAVDGEERVPHHRAADGWMEIELGHFYNGEGVDEVKISLKNDHRGGISKRGLIIEGVEARPYA